MYSSFTYLHLYCIITIAVRISRMYYVLIMLVQLLLSIGVPGYELRRC